MAKNWLVAVDDGVWAEFAFNYAIEYICPKVDRLYLIHVKDIPMKIATWNAQRDLEIVRVVTEAEDARSKKILGHFSKRCRDAGVPSSIFAHVDIE
jgi:hypothetical protein